MSVKTLQNYSISSSLDTIKNLFAKFKKEKLLSIEDDQNMKNLIEQLKLVNEVCKSTNTSYSKYKLQELKSEIYAMQNKIKKIILHQLDHLHLEVCEIEQIIREKNFKKEVEESTTLQMLLEIHDMDVLDYDGYTCHGGITWKMWDKHFEIMKAIHKDISWSQYTNLQILLCLFLWGAYHYPNDYNNNLNEEDKEEYKNKKHPTLLKDKEYTKQEYISNYENDPKNLEEVEKSIYKDEWKKAIEIMNNKLGKNFDKYYRFTKVWEQVKYDDNKFKNFINTQRVLIEKQSFSIKMFRARIPNFRAGEFGKYEFFITLDGFIKNDLDIPYELMKKFASSRIIKAVKYCEKNKIAIIRYNLETMKCCGLKPDDLRDFGSIKAIETRKDSNDWIRYYEKNICEKNKYLRDFKNKKVKYSV
jgi:hypothetical protein